MDRLMQIFYYFLWHLSGCFRVTDLAGRYGCSSAARGFVASDLKSGTVVSP
jgi:hypothetical protein